MCKNLIKNIYIDNCINNGFINSASGTGICGQSCTNFTIVNSKNYADITGQNGATSQGGIVGNGSSNFVVTKCINGTRTNNIYGSSVGGIVGPDCTNFTVCKCVNNANIIGGWSAGIVGQNCYDFNLYKCVNNGLIGDNSAGIIAYQSGAINNSIMKITKCINNGNIIGANAGGITGQSFFNYYAPQVSDIKVSIYKCINNGLVLQSSSAGICGSKCLDTTSQNVLSVLNDYVYELKLVKCYTKYGSLIGNNCFNTDLTNTNPYPPRVLKLINCKTGSRIYVSSFNTTTNVIAYRINHHNKIDLL